ncbi:MAG: ABC transporter substrate-binding protein, partial [Ilumatobacteraceae bacterium]
MACGSDKKTTSSTAAPTTVAAATTAGAATTTAGSATTTAGGSATTSGATGTTGGATATTGASSAGIGLIDGKYQGTGDFTIDPKDCPADWNPKQGITDSEIDLFMSLPSAGAFAGFGLIADGVRAYMKDINDAGGIGGRKVVLDSKDDGYQPAQTKANVDEA